MTKCFDILRKSARKVRKMLENSEICDKCHSSFHFSVQSVPLPRSPHVVAGPGPAADGPEAHGQGLAPDPGAAGSRRSSGELSVRQQNGRTDELIHQLFDELFVKIYQH